mmetsp:Transcript_34463/g.89264  ORF Transcript_34463/g.89264 Transcript_34463/m.89264 type:complete len:543 (+) Transcript_34463:293-1921(+)|eukprot:CAMPEP_0113912806 /NCGR_PEP_ID=MMETSP0780_2-20120614/29153_1 /TAXON_ID=652834 /ORGANISM="Palpitomonas bilix" /LENGTH=542 /DNA_ID=CAMNT_0000909849 /DNA_START=222 /DNA_END=1850 /DNA_ORIENTATION=+ /assembly_acc=CAM_ASM_000599
MFSQLIGRFIDWLHPRARREEEQLCVRTAVSTSTQTDNGESAESLLPAVSENQISSAFSLSPSQMTAVRIERRVSPYSRPFFNHRSIQKIQRISAIQRREMERSRRGIQYLRSQPNTQSQSLFTQSKLQALTICDLDSAESTIDLERSQSQPKRNDLPQSSRASQNEKRRKEEVEKRIERRFDFDSPRLRSSSLPQISENRKSAKNGDKMMGSTKFDASWRSQLQRKQGLSTVSLKDNSITPSTKSALSAFDGTNSQRKTEITKFQLSLASSTRSQRAKEIIRQSQQKLKEDAETFQRKTEWARNRDTTPAILRAYKNGDNAEENVKAALSRGRGDEVLVENFLIPVQRHLMQCLLPGKWLKSNIIDYVLGMLRVSFGQESTYSKKEYFMNSHFYEKLSTRGYDGVKRWAKKVNIFELDKLVCPINLHNTHWALGVIEMKKKRIQYFDSMCGGGGGGGALGHLKSYLENEYKRQNDGKDGDFSEWVEEGVAVPQQQNGYDCGVFVCTMMYYVAKDLPFDYTQENMGEVRKALVYYILKGKLE